MRKRRPVSTDVCSVQLVGLARSCTSGLAKASRKMAPHNPAAEIGFRNMRTGSCSPSSDSNFGTFMVCRKNVLSRRNILRSDVKRTRNDLYGSYWCHDRAVDSTQRVVQGRKGYKRPRLPPVLGITFLTTGSYPWVSQTSQSYSSWVC